MRRVMLGALLGALCLPLFGGQWDRWERRRGSPYGGNYRRYDSPVDRVLNNLSRIASRAYVDNHERDHFENAMRHLQEFLYRFQQGRFDRGRLDRAIGDMSHLADARQLHPRDREMIRRDINQLRAFRR